jgi:hypothetical protein
MTVIIRDVDGDVMECGIDHFDFDVAVDLYDYRVVEPTCLSQLNDQGGSAGSADFVFSRTGLTARYCGFASLYEDTSGVVTLFTSDDCINDTASKLDGALDPDGDGIPTAYDNLPNSAANGDCAVINGMVSLANHSFASGITHCPGEGESKASLIAVGKSVGVAAGAELHLYSDKINMFAPASGTGLAVASGGVFDTSQLDPPVAAARSAESVTLAESVTVGTKTLPVVIGPTKLTRDQLPDGLQSILNAFDAVATDIFADATDSYIVFATESALTVADGNEVSDVYLYEIDKEIVRSISINALGETGNGASTQPRIDGGGNYVVYSSEASDLISGDTNGVSDIYISVLAIGLTERASNGVDGKEAMSAAQNPAIASNQPQILYDRLDESGQYQVFSYEYDWPELGTVSVTENIGVDHHHPVVSPNGEFVAYVESAGVEPLAVECRLVVYDQIEGVQATSACSADAILNGEYQYFSVTNEGQISY